MASGLSGAMGPLAFWTAVDDQSGQSQTQLIGRPSRCGEEPVETVTTQSWAGGRPEQHPAHRAPPGLTDQPCEQEPETSRISAR
jgi:hypothetical protein